MLRFARGFSKLLMANDIQSRRLGKLRPVKERNQRVRRSKPATRQLEKHAQGRLIYSLCHTAGEGGGKKNKTARLVWVGKVEFSRPEPRLPAAGLCLHKPKARDGPEQDALLTGMLQDTSSSPAGPRCPEVPLNVSSPCSCIPVHTGRRLSFGSPTQPRSQLLPSQLRSDGSRCFLLKRAYLRGPCAEPELFMARTSRSFSAVPQSGTGG